MFTISTAVPSITSIFLNKYALSDKLQVFSSVILTESSAHLGGYSHSLCTKEKVGSRAENMTAVLFHVACLDTATYMYM